MPVRRPKMIALDTRDSINQPGFLKENSKYYPKEKMEHAPRSCH